MTTLRLPVLLLLITLSVTAVGSAQEVAIDDGDATQLSLDRIFTDEEFKTARAPSLRWLDDGSHYTTLEESAAFPERFDIVRHNAGDGSNSVLVPAGRLIPEGKADPLEVEDYHWSDDGERLLIFTNTRKVWRRNTRGDYWVLNLESGDLKQLGGDAPEATLMFAKFSPDGGRVGYVSERNIYVQSLADDAITQLTETESEAIINGTSDWVYEEELSLRDGFRWSPDGERIAYWQFDTSGTDTFYMLNNTDELYPKLTAFNYPKAGSVNSAVRVGVVSAAGGETTWFKEDDDPRNHYPARMQWAASSDEVVVQHLNRLQNKLDVLVGDANTGKFRTLLVEEDDAWVDAVSTWAWLEDGSYFLWSSERDGWRHIYRVARDGGALELITPGDFDVVSIERVDSDGGWLYFTAAPDNPLERALLRARLDASGVVERLTPESQQGTHSYQVSLNGSWALHTHSSFGLPPTIDFVSLPDHTSHRVLVDNAEVGGKLDAIERGEHRFFRVAGADGTQLDGWEIRPPDFDPSQKYPLLFYVYGEPWGQTVADRWGGNGYLWHLMLSQQGYIVISIDNRGTAAPRGHDWRKVIYENVGPIASADQAAAARQILDWGYVDPERVGIWGWSGGGSMTLNMLFRHPDIYKTGVSVAAVPDQRYYDTIYQERYSGHPETSPESYKQGSPITFADQLQGNLLIVHGTGDDNVHYQGAEALINKLIAGGKKFSMMAYPNRTHGISEGDGTTRHLYGLMTDYLNEHSPPNAKAEVEVGGIGPQVEPIE
jgi:dipeptidyl-peptidase-4